MSHEEDRIVEIAAARLDLGAGGYEISSVLHCLVDPQRSIPPAASAVHHLTDADIVDARSLVEAIDYLEICPNDVLVAHNADFDKGFLPLLKGHDWICTWKVAQKLLPEAPAYGNQVLRYYLGLNVEGGHGRNGQPHSAGYDARTTALLMAHLLTLAPVDYMIEITKAPVILARMPFGKHRGTAFADVPKDYLMWLKGRPDLDRDLRHTLEHHT
jgi:exodeoxyribonuclease X